MAASNSNLSALALDAAPLVLRTLLAAEQRDIVHLDATSLAIALGKHAPHPNNRRTLDPKVRGRMLQFLYAAGHPDVKVDGWNLELNEDAGRVRVRAIRKVPNLFCSSLSASG